MKTKDVKYAPVVLKYFHNIRRKGRSFTQGILNSKTCNGFMPALENMTTCNFWSRCASVLLYSILLDVPLFDILHPLLIIEILLVAA